MKKIYFLTLILLAAVTGWSQTKTWNGPATGGSWTTNSNWSPTGAPGTNDVVIINGGVSGTITAVPSITLRGLRIEGNSTVTFTATGNRTIGLGGVGGSTSLNIESGSSLILAGGNTINIDFSRGTGGGTTLGTIAGLLEIGNSSTVYFDNNNTLTTVTGTIEVSSNAGSLTSAAARLTFASGGTYIHNRNGGDLPSANWNAASTCRIEGVTNTLPNNYSQSFGNFVWSCTGQTSGLSFAGSLNVINGDFIVANTGTGDIRLKQTGPTSTTTVGGNFVLSGGTLYIIQSNNTHTLEVAGNVNISGGTLARAGGGGAIGNFVFNGSSEQTFTKTGGTISGAVNFTVNSGASVNFGTSLLDGTSATFTLSAGAKIITSNAAGLASSGGSGSIRVGGTRTYSNGADYEFRGAATGGFTTTNSDVRDLIINNTSGQVSMGRNFNVTRALTLTNGYITPGANTLLVGTAGTSTSSNGAYVNGQLSKQFNGNQAFTFYVGKTAANGLRSIGLTTNSGGGTSTFVAELLRASGSNVSAVYGSGISRVSQCEYWTLNRSGGSRGGQVTLSWDANSPCNGGQYVTELTSLRVARYDGTAWQNAGPASGGANFGSTLGAGTITSSNVTNFSPFALATSNAAENPLPVLFADVKAYSKNNGVQVEWSNLTEREILHYEVERSANGIDFYAVNQQLPRSNRDDKASYTFFDASPVNGANYYRVRVQEQSGKVIYSKILRVEMGSTKYSFSLYPNPVTGKQLTVSLNGVKQGKYNVQIIDAAGQRVFTTNLSNVGTGVTQMIELPASVKTGMYVMIVSADDYRETKQFIVR